MTRGASPEEIARALGNASPIAGGYKCKCPGHDDQKASLQINIKGKDGRPSIFCHSCGSGSEGRIYKAIEEQTGLHFEGREIQSTRTQKRKTLLVPAPIAFPKTMNLQRYGPANTFYEYRDQNNRLCMVVGRWELPQGKEIRPATCVEQNGQPHWEWTINGYEPRVLYNTPELAARTDVPVLVVEGEKAADAAKFIFPEYVVVTFQGGTKAWKKSDWTLLKGRDVILWPDNDAPGKEAFISLGKYLNVHGFSKSVKLAQIPNDWPKGWDLADEAPEDLATIRFIDAPQGGTEDLYNNIDVGNFYEVFDQLYWLYYDGRMRWTVSKQAKLHQQGRPFGLDKAHLINTNHEAWRSLILKEGPAIAVWADDKMRTKDYITGEVFEPGGEDVVRTPNGLLLNSFNGWTYKPERTGSCENFKRYVLHVLCGGDAKAYDYIWNYLSHMLQFPQERPTVALVFKGIQGAGKSFFGHVITNMLGGLLGYGWHASTIDSIAGKFNAPLASKLLICIEELEITKSRSMENRLKSLITDKMISIERKGKDPILLMNYARLIGSTNHEHIWNVEDGERRLSLFEVSSDKANDRKYFEDVIDELQSGGYGRLMFELTSHPVDKSMVDRPFNNTAKRKQAMFNPEPARDLAFEFLRKGYVMMKVVDDRNNTIHFQAYYEEQWREEPIFISSKIARVVLEEMIAKGKYTERYSPRDRRATARAVADYLGGDGRYNTKDVYYAGNNSKDNCYRIPDLVTARHHFAKAVNLPYEELFEDEAIDNVVQFRPASTEPPF